MSGAHTHILIGIGACLAAMIIIGLWYTLRSNASGKEYFPAKHQRSCFRTLDNAIALPEFFSKRFHDKSHFLLTNARVISKEFEEAKKRSYNI